MEGGGCVKLLVNFCWGVLLIWTIGEQGPTVLVVDAGGGVVWIFFSYPDILSFLLISGRRLDIDSNTVSKGC